MTGETDWKIQAIDVRDKLAKDLNGELYSMSPRLLHTYNITKLFMFTYKAIMVFDLLP